VAPGKQNDVDTETKRLRVYRYRAPARPLSTLKPWKPNDMFSAARVLRSGRAATMAAVAAGPTARIIALWALPCGHWARYASRQRGVPYTVWTLGSDIWTLGQFGGIRGVIRRVLLDASVIFSDGIQLAEDTRKIGRCPVEFLPSTRNIDSRHASQPREQPPYRLSFIGRWHPNKGIDLLLSALQQLAESDWARIERISIYGGGPMAREVGLMAQRLVASGRPVTLGGYLNKSEAERIMGETDWLLIPSRIESIPLIYSDALKLSVPVLATPVGDLEYLVREDKSGELAETTSASAIAALMHEALSRSPADYQDALSSAATRFDLERIADRLMMNTESSNGR